MANTFIFDDEEEPNMGGNMTPEQDDDEQPAEEEGEGSNNRTFYIILGVLGGVVVLAVLCAVLYFVFMRPVANQPDAAATSAFLTQQAAITPTETASPTLEVSSTPMLTETPTTTPVVAVFESEVPDPNQPTMDPDLATATVLAATLEASRNQEQTTTATFAAKDGVGKTSTALPGTKSATPGPGTPSATSTSKIPQTGFAEDVGLPVLALVTLLLLGVIFMARRLRAAPGR